MKFLEGNKKWRYLAVTLFVGAGLASIIPSQDNPFTIGVNTVAKEQGLDPSQLDVISASYQIVFLYHTVSLELYAHEGHTKKKINAKLHKFPFGEFHLTQYEIKEISKGIQ